MKFKEVAFVFCMVLPGASAPAQAASPSADVPRIECESLHDLMETDRKPVLVDVRTPVDYKEAHIAGAVSVPFYKLPKEAAWPKQTSLVLYCAGKGCSLSYDLAAALIKEGFTDVKVLNGGIREWELKEYPVVREKKSEETPRPVRGNTVFKGKTVTAKQLSEQLGMLRASIAAKAPQIGGSGGDILILDSRPEAEFAAAHLPGAVNIPLEKLREKLKDLPEGAEVVVCDRTAQRSEQAAALINGAGLPAHYLAGGLVVWSTAGYGLIAGKTYEK
ncbi:MAG: rhodanese-like domain-containing protein [Elusimicrobiales bacterium]|jgi:rhodanese-related sulfurtransferase